ncbi:predicted protein [Cyanophage PSS2]|uniref:hypothetical protein n=1 Tax=Cyanophage PSS2 TaxID=658401 RepID=UPI0001B03FE6|nr:hypothetical protein PSS2_gp017 [Cyanophage PSS2]ACT65579.1 hypothetical protein [Cyanophage PSS2]ACY75721.1 predicted protein [Cyanophage PSS2]
MTKATLQTAAFAEANRFTNGQAISFEILMLAQAGMNIKAAMAQVCGVNLDLDATDEEVLAAVKETFFDHITDEQIALATA